MCPRGGWTQRILEVILVKEKKYSNKRRSKTPKLNIEKE